MQKKLFAIFSSKMRSQKESGVTLLLSILVLASILAISFSLAAILFVEVRTSRDLVTSTTAFYGSFALTEDAIFKTIRNVPGGATTGTSSIGGIKITTQSTTTSTPVQIVIVRGDTSHNTTCANSSYRYLITDSIDATKPPNYKTIIISYLSSSVSAAPLGICLTESPPTGESGDTVICDGGSLKCGDPITSSILNGVANTYTVIPLNTGKNYELALANATAANIGVEIQSFKACQPPPEAGCVPIIVAGQSYGSGLPFGLPYFDQTLLQINASGVDVNRKFQVIIPGSGGVSSAPLGNSAAFNKVDTTTQGNWHGIYGNDGYNIIGVTQNYPSYVTVTPAGNSCWDFVAGGPCSGVTPTSDIRGLYKDSVSTTRVANCWYGSSGSFTVDLNFTDSIVHQIAIYALDWNNGGRAMTINILDGANSSILDSRNVAIGSNFVNGEYYVWNVSGHVVVQINRTAGVNPVISGIFFK